MNKGAWMSDRKLMAVEIGVAITKTESEWLDAFLSAVHGGDYAIANLQLVPARIRGVLAAAGFYQFAAPIALALGAGDDPMVFVRELVDRIAPREPWKDADRKPRGGDSWEPGVDGPGAGQ